VTGDAQHCKKNKICIHDILAKVETTIYCWNQEIFFI
jgi:hypothetical protein